ncbi:hypothetical protein Goshw_025352, partial [Gossypium schwendimanii]|nr:hypothetical protein [Gossypium schwendimanii]
HYFWAKNAKDDGNVARPACGIVTPHFEAKEVTHKAKEDTQQLPSILRRRRDDEAENDVEAAFSMLGEVQGVAFTMFESLFSHINGTEMESKLTNWFFLSKLMSCKRITHEGEATETNEFEKVDAVLCTLIGNKTRKSCKMSIDDAKHSRS